MIKSCISLVSLNLRKSGNSTEGLSCSSFNAATSLLGSRIGVSNSLGFAPARVEVNCTNLAPLPGTNVTCKRLIFSVGAIERLAFCMCSCNV